MEISIQTNNQIFKMTKLMPLTLNEYIVEVATSRLANKFQDKYIYAGKYREGEEYTYFESDEYVDYLNYLIETWKIHIENEFYYDINYDGNFEYISKYFEAGVYCPDFNDEWLYDIFEHHILDRVVLK